MPRFRGHHKRPKLTVAQARVLDTAEQKWIGGALHYRLPCRGCGVLIWVGRLEAVRGRPLCTDCGQGSGGQPGRRSFPGRSGGVYHGGYVE